MVKDGGGGQIERNREKEQEERKKGEERESLHVSTTTEVRFSTDDVVRQWRGCDCVLLCFVRCVHAAHTCLWVHVYVSHALASRSGEQGISC